MNPMMRRVVCTFLASAALIAVQNCGDDPKPQDFVGEPTLPGTRTTTVLPHAHITLDEAPSKCIDIKGADRAVGTPAVLNSCGDSNSQLFAFGNNRLHVYIHKCLEVQGGRSTPGAKVVINNCELSDANQVWTRNGQTWVWAKGGLCLDLPGNVAADGAPLQVWPCNGTGAQQWSDAGHGAVVAQPTAPVAPPAPPPQPTPSAQYLPTVQGECPPLNTGMATFAGQQVQLWAADPSHRNGSLVFFWHGTGGSPQDAIWALGAAQIKDVVAKGGMVAAFASSRGTGANLNGNHVWFGDDFYTADQVVACAIRDLHIDPRRIYSTGASAGGLASTWMAYGRSGYIAAVAPLSGGMLGQRAQQWGDPSAAPQDPTNVPFALVTHGAKGVDVYAPTNFDFAISSGLYEADIANKGGMSIDCNTGGGHVSGPPAISASIWQFFQDHPFKQSPEPYQGKVPASFPAYCQIGPISY